MTDSRTTHGALTEGVRKTMSGKGREGNKEGKGRLREPFTTSSSYVTREVVQTRAGHPRDVVVSATRLDDRPDLDTIEHLDFDPVVPCEARIRGGLHGGRADVLIVGQCPGCAATKRNLRRYGMCWRHWRKAKSVELTCEACGHKDVMAGGFFRIVEVLR